MKCLSILLFVSLLFNSISTFSNQNEIIGETLLSDEYELLSISQSQLQNIHDDHNTDVVSQLNEWKEELLSINSSDSLLIRDEIDDLIIEYNQLSVQPSTIDNTITEELVNSGYRITILLAISYFRLMQYKFSAECLRKAYSNSSNSLIYYDVLFHSVIYNQLYNNLPVSTSSFSSLSNPIERDCYFSIRNFNVLSKNGKYYINDIYNFHQDGNYPDVIEELVGIFEKAEKRGLLTPFEINIELENPHYTIVNGVNLFHTYDCTIDSCKLHIIEFTHDFTFVPLADGHYKKCTICSYETNLFPHNYIDEFFDLGKHKTICSDCDYFIYNNHIFEYRYSSQTQHLVQCTDCLYSFYEDHEIEILNFSTYVAPSKKACRKCGHIFL